MKLIGLVAFLIFATASAASALTAGVGKVEITDHEARPVNDPSYVRALVLQEGNTIAVLITLDAVAVGELGRIRNDYLPKIRERLQADFGIAPENVIVNASHCHSTPRLDTDALTIQAVAEAVANMVPVMAGAGSAHEDGISENRRVFMNDGSEVDMRRAYSMPRDEDIARIGPIDPQVGILRLDRDDGRPLAVVYNFACHPIMNPPWKGNSADFPGFASRVIEENLGNGAVALFVQGCGGDINPVRYKEVNTPPDAEPLGTRLGVNVLRAVRTIQPVAGAKFAVSNQSLSIPRGADLKKRIANLEAQRTKLVASLKPTNINFKAFLPLYLQQKISPDYPSHYAQSYLHDEARGRSNLAKLDEQNRGSVDAYLHNVHTMEQLTRLNTNLALLRKHLARNQAAGKPTLDVEVAGLRVGDFKLVTFPGELTVEVGLAIKKAFGDPHAFVAGYTNGYIYYTPTTEQRLNTGFAQEDCDSFVASEWQKLFETKAVETLANLK